MKALYCPKCHDIVLLVFDLRTCRCGEVKGYYRNERYAVTNGRGIAMVFGTGDFEDALIRLANTDTTFNREFYQEHCRLNWVWVRPHTGDGNPHTTVEEDLGE